MSRYVVLRQTTDDTLHGDNVLVLLGEWEASTAPGAARAARQSRPNMPVDTELVAVPARYWHVVKR